MFNRLPPELVRQIIAACLSSTYRWWTYKKERALLRSLCLVCKLFRDIAQPLLFEFVWIDEQWKLDALHRTLEEEGWRAAIRRLVVQDTLQALDTEYLKRILRSCQGLRSLTLQLESGWLLDLSVLQDLPHLADLSLSGRHYELPYSFRLRALTSLGIDAQSIEVAPTLLDPVVLPSLRSLAMFNIYDDNERSYLNRSRLDQLVPHLEVLSLNSRIIQRGLDCLIPAYSRTLFDFYSPTSDARIPPLRVAQHLCIHRNLNPKNDIQELVVLITNRDWQIALRSIYLDLSLEDLSSLPVDLVKAVQDLLTVCKAMRIEVIYEEQEVGLACELRPSEEFRRRQREIRNLKAASE